MFRFLFSEINPFPYLVTLFDSKIVLLDMDQNQIVWTFSTERDISSMGYTADDGMGYYAQGDSLYLLNMHNRSTSEVSHYVNYSGRKDMDNLHTTLPYN